MLPDLHTDFSRGRSSGLVLPSLSEFSTVYCDPHSEIDIVDKAEIGVFLALSSDVFTHLMAFQIFLFVIFSAGFPVALLVKNLADNAGDFRNEGSIPRLGRSPGGGCGNSLQYSCLENLRIDEPGGLQSIVSQGVRHD